MSSQAIPGGLALGALGCGVLVQYAPFPTRLVYVIFLVGMVLSAVAVLPETATRKPGAAASLIPRLGVPAHIRADFSALIPIQVATWALGGLYLSLGPSVAAGVFGLTNHLIGGLVVAVLGGSSAITAVALRKRGHARAVLDGGAILLAVGSAVTLVGLLTDSVVPAVIGTVLGGVGFGAAVLGSPPASRPTQWACAPPRSSTAPPDRPVRHHVRGATPAPSVSSLMTGRIAMPEALSVIQTSLVHNIHRRATTMLAEAAANPAVPADAIASLREFLVLNLEHHHTTEDDDLWPLINAADPSAAIAMSSLSGEHHILDEALKTILAADLRDRSEFVGAARLVRNVVHRHLGDEEPILFPTLREHITPEAWDGFARYVTQTAPTVERHLMIGFTDLVGTDEQIQAILGGLPPQALEEMRKQSRAQFDLLRGED